MILQRLADAVERHHGHGLGKLSDGHCADAGHRHQQELTEQVAVSGRLDGLAQHA